LVEVDIRTINKIIQSKLCFSQHLRTSSTKVY